MTTSATPVQLVDPATGVPYSAISGSGASANQVQGNVASSATDAGNPVKVAGKFNTTKPTLTDGQRGDLQLTSRGALAVTLHDSTGLNPLINSNYPASDSWTTASLSPTLGVSAFSMVFNGTSWDRQRGDSNGAFSVSKGGSNMATGQVAVTTSATLVAAARAGRQMITLSPTTAVVYYVGNTGVTSSTGLYVAAGASITLETAAAVYAVGASAVTISYIEFY